MKMNKAISFILAIAIALSLCPSGAAMDDPPEELEQNTNQIVFCGLSQLDVGESFQRAIEGADGNEALVGIERVRGYARSGGETWRVWYSAIGTNVEFYMTVSNNKVTSVYDYSISLLGATYSDASLTNTQTYGKLTFQYKSIAGIISSTCWLKGTVTGVDDQIEVTWQM